MLKQLAFAAVFAFTLGLFAYNLTHFIKIAALGRPADLKESWGQRIQSLMTFFFGQRKVAEERRSYHHLLIYWGFLILSIASLEMFMQGLLGEWFNFSYLITTAGYQYLALVIDWANLVVVTVMVYAIIRRIVQPAFVPMSLDAMLILGAISLLCISHFGYHGFHMAQAGHYDWSHPISGRFAALVGAQQLEPYQRSINPDTAHLISETFWWVHVGILLGFLNYLPFSKHIHVLGSAPNILLRNQGQRGAMPKVKLFDDPPKPEDGEDEDDSYGEEEGEPLMQNWGVGKIEQFTWKSLIDNYSCTECARCTSYCPAFATDKPLSPMHLIHDLKDEMKDRGSKLLQLKALGVDIRKLELDEHVEAEDYDPENYDQPDEDEDEGDEDGDESGEAKEAAKPARPEDGPNKDLIAQIKKELRTAPPLVGGRIKDETLWACTTCGACQEVCPVFIDHPLKILQMRQWIVLNDETGRTPGEASNALTNITNSGNPWGMPEDDRMAWADGLDVPEIEDNPGAEYLLFVGCAGAYDDNAKKTTRALVAVLRAAGVTFAVLGKQEKCTGDTLRRLGDEMNFQMLAAEQVELLNENKVTKVIATCPHCFHVIKNEYPQFGGEYEVIHHSQLITHLLDSGKLKVDNPLEKRITYHDSCYLGRWNQVYDQPRSVLQAATRGRGSFTELTRNREHGFCCGAGGGRMWMEEEPSKRVNINRAKEIAESGANAVAVGCPFCNTMISDGMKAVGKEEEIEVMDLAQVIAATLPQQDDAGAEASA
ncbi:MAG: (Fe-S)-binding protein [Myxococcales bacterium]|nr:(Fe-S)-binding protein [Myxococcales bacterium]MCB9756131.1 (Fe-S)-binding protein [Myxococcales bacterium]